MGATNAAGGRLDFLAGTRCKPETRTDKQHRKNEGSMRSAATGLISKNEITVPATDAERRRETSKDSSEG